MEDLIEVRECTTLDELSECVDLQRAVFALPEIEISPVRHFVVTKNAGGFVLGAYDGERLVGFVLSVPAFLRGEKAFYSHMTAVHADYQSRGVGRQLKWGQRTKALEAGVNYVKWTFEPWKARNAYFNLEKLGASIREYERNFYGVDYTTAAQSSGKIGLASDRLFAEWDLRSEKVRALAEGRDHHDTREPAAEIEVPNDWYSLVAVSPSDALAVQERLRREFETAFADGLVAEGFARDPQRPRYLLYRA
jgi:predicted GNAT superfamily acetyltransferase